MKYAMYGPSVTLEAARAKFMAVCDRADYGHGERVVAHPDAFTPLDAPAVTRVLLGEGGR